MQPHKHGMSCQQLFSSFRVQHMRGKLKSVSRLWFSILLAVAIFAILLGRAKMAQGCANFFIDSTGQQTCLDEVINPPASTTSDSPGSGGSGASGSSGSQSGGPQTPNRDRVVVNSRPSQRMSESQISKASPLTNPLPPPDTRAVRPERRLQEASGAKPSPTLFNEPADNNSALRDFGSFGIPYTAARVSHKATTSVSSRSEGYLSATYPYRTIGRLTFQTDSGSASCSASLIRRGIIVTAAHCIQDFDSGSNIYSGWTFTPAFYDGDAPYDSWSWFRLVRPSSWANGTDTGSGSARNNDLALIALQKNSSDQFVGDIVGWLSYGWNNYSFVSNSQTGDLAVAALSTLGYPGLLDQGSIMQRSDSPSYLTTVSGSEQIYQGSTFTGGASGGPWIANFKYQDPTFSSGAGPGSAGNNNIIVGVTSWGSADPNAPKDNYSSQFGQNTEYPNASYGTYGAGNIGSLLNTLCSSSLDGQTLASQGYCD